MEKVTYSTDELVKAVKICIDEIAANDGDYVGEQDEEELATIIKSKINEAMWFCFGNCQVDLISGNVSISSASVTSDAQGVATVDVTNTDMIRLVWGNLSSWKYSVSDLVMQGSEEEAIVRNEYCGADCHRPAIVVCNTTSAKQLKFYKTASVSSSETYTIAYMPKVTKDTSGLQIDATLYGAIVYYVASLTEVTLQNKEFAQELLEVALSMMGVTQENNKVN